MRVVTADEMKNIDETAIKEYGYPGEILMENAGLEAAKLVLNLCEKNHYANEVLIICGKGKNGGDGLVVARRLFASGVKCRVFLLHDPKEYSGEAATSLKILQSVKAKISVIESSTVLEEYFKAAPPPFLVIDAMLGTGLARNLDGIYYDTVRLINEYATEVVSLDIPSGVNGDTGDVAGGSVYADHTISFGYPKLGHILHPGATRTGKLYTVDLSFPQDWNKKGNKFLLHHKNTAYLLQSRDKYGHKNSFGHSLLLGGSEGHLGAIVMASRGCLKVGTGLVTVASWEDSFPSLEVKLSSEIMNHRITKKGNEYSFANDALENFSSLVIGPGMGMREEGTELLKQVLSTFPGPVVVDADGLNLLAQHKLHDLVSQRRAPTVLTPHPGEMARLLDVEKEVVVREPLKCVKECFEKTGAVTVLKGATTMIHSDEGITWVNHYPNDGMATAGSGDVLAGMIGGLFGQNLTGLEAARLGVYVHTLAGRYAAQAHGHRAMTALTIVENIRFAFKELREYVAPKVKPACVELY